MDQTRTKDDIEIETATWDIQRRILDNTVNVIADIAKDADINLTNDAIRAIDSINTLRMDIDCRLDLIREGE